MKTGIWNVLIELDRSCGEEKGTGSTGVHHLAVAAGYMYNTKNIYIYIMYTYIYIYKHI